MKTSDNEKSFALHFGRQITAPVTCVRCGKIIPIRPSNLDVTKAFPDGNFIHDADTDGKTWRECNPRHAKNCA